MKPSGRTGTDLKLLAGNGVISSTNQDSSPAPASSQLGGALQHIPATTGFSISGSDLSSLKKPTEPTVAANQNYQVQ